MKSKQISGVVNSRKGVRAALCRMDCGLHGRAADPYPAVCVHRHGFRRGHDPYRGKPCARVFAAVYDGLLAQRADGAHSDGGMLLLGYPVAYMLSRMKPNRAAILSILFILPMWDEFPAEDVRVARPA